MKNNLNPVLVILIFIVIGCACSSPKTGNAPNGIIDKPSVEYIHGTKITTIYSEKEDKTSVYQLEFKFQPDLIVNKNIVKEKHVFQFDNSSEYKGKVPNCTNTSLSIIHSIFSDGSWHFEPKTKASIKLDAEVIEIPPNYQRPLGKTNSTDQESFEGFIVQPTCEIYSKIINAKTIGFQIGNGSFEFSEENKLAFQEFANRTLPPK
jgi:hypothetical protein